MNFDVVKAVQAAPLQPASHKLVALTMAIHANKDTGKFWPSMATLASECSLSVAQVKRVIRELRALDVLVVVTPSTGGRKSSTVVYSFDLAKLVHLAHGGTPFTDEPPSSVSQYPGHWGASRGLIREPEPRSPVSHEVGVKRSETQTKTNRRSAAAGPGRSAPGSSPAAERTGFMTPGYYD